MRRHLVWSFCAVALVGGSIAAPAASAQQAVNLYIGAFVPHGMDSRGGDDVLFRNADFLRFNIKDFTGVTAGGEYLVGLNDFIDAGLGVGIYSRTSPAAYRDLVFNTNGGEIRQDWKLRIVPMTATIRLLPLGHRDAITPYIGGGVGIYAWRYSETGEFVDVNKDVFRDTFIGSGTAVGPVVLGGLRVPIGSGGIGFEIRYHGGHGELPASETFAGPKIDLGGFNYLATFTIGL